MFLNCKAPLTGVFLGQLGWPTSVSLRSATRSTKPEHDTAFAAQNGSSCAFKNRRVFCSAGDDQCVQATSRWQRHSMCPTQFGESTLDGWAGCPNQETLTSSDGLGACGLGFGRIEYSPSEQCEFLGEDMGKKKADKPTPATKQVAADDTDEKEKKRAMVGCTSANFHEASRSEYLAHYIFSSFGTSVPVPRQEDTGLDLYCTLTERVGQRIWPRAYYAVQVKSTPGPWAFEGPESVRWVVEHPHPLFLCVVIKKTATLSIYHTSPRFYVWSAPPLPDRLVMVPGNRGKGYGTAWEKEGYKLDDPDAFPLSAPIAEFTVNEILNDGFKERIQKVLALWASVDAENLYRIQAGIRHFTTLDEYVTNETTEATSWTKSGLMKAGETEIDVMLPRFIEGLKWFSRQLYQNDDLRGSLRAELLLRHLKRLDNLIDGAGVHHLHSRLNNYLTPPLTGGERKDFYAGLDVVSQRIDELTAEALEQAKAKLDEERKTG